MTENEAIEELSIEFLGEFDRQREAKNLAIKALEEIQQYRVIGTAEECRAAMEKQVAMKPLMGTNMMTKKKYKVCPKCGENLIDTDYQYFYCDMCGQKLDWSDEEWMQEKSQR